MGFSLLTVDGQYVHSRVCSLSSCACGEVERSVRREHFDLWAQHRQSHHLAVISSLLPLPLHSRAR